MKRCSRCKKDKPIVEFWRFNRAPDGLQYYCKACANALPVNREKKAARDRRYRKKHRASLRARKKVYANTHSEQIAARGRAYYTINRDRLLEQGRRRGANWRAENPNKNAAKEARRRARKARAAQGDPKLAIEFAAILREGICEQCASEGPIHVDHIVPLARGGEDAWENYAGLCRSCNSSKRDKPMLHSMLESI